MQNHVTTGVACRDAKIRCLLRYLHEGCTYFSSFLLLFWGLVAMGATTRVFGFT